jgi:preprotein translocase subunit SecD
MIDRAFLKDRRIVALALLLLLSGILWLAYGLHFGLEFKGGTRIPITLERGLDQQAMAEAIETIKSRVNKYGLSQVVVKSIGDRDLIVEVPQSDESVITSIERVLKEQGRFEAVVDGKTALVGADILSVGGAQGERVFVEGGTVRWSVDFAVSRSAAERFSKVVFGKAEYPVYMFLDRPEKAVLLISKSALGSSEEAKKLATDALRKEGDDISLFFIDDWNASRSAILALNATKKTAILPANASAEIRQALNASGFALLEKDAVAPEFNAMAGSLLLERWSAIGLLTAPTLNAQITTGSVSIMYVITGAGKGSTTAEQEADARTEIKVLKSILSGGRLPVNAILGSSYTVSPTLGEQFLGYSAVGALAAILVVVSVIVLRYRTLRLVLPIVMTSFIELVVLVVVIGSLGTIDLSAMAGIIAAVGTSVDDQIVITDEAMKRRETEQSTKRRLGKAFYIIYSSKTVAIIALLPLLFSGLVEIMGFAVSTIIGTLLGVLVTRPAYGAMVERMFGK